VTADAENAAATDEAQRAALAEAAAAGIHPIAVPTPFLVGRVNSTRTAPEGYHFSRPLPAAEITRMLQGGPAWLPPGRVVAHLAQG
jgi:hypothetical protein